MKIWFAAALFATNAVAADYTPPPRTVDDILAVLDEYKPDPSKTEQRNRAANAEPPTNVDKAVLAQFYLERARARSRLGQVNRQIEDLRAAAELSKGTMTGRRRGGFNVDLGDELTILASLSGAEFKGGNFVNAVKVSEARLESMERQSRPRPGVVFGGYAQLAELSALMGDLRRAHEDLSRAETMFPMLRQLANWGDYGTQWTAQLERAHGAVYAAEGNYAAAESALRKSVDLLDAGRAANEQRFRSGMRAFPPGGWLSMRNENQLQLALAMAQQGRLAEAEAAARDALIKNLGFFGRYSPEAAASLNALSTIVAEQGRFSDAGKLAAAAIDSLEKSGAAPESVQLASARRAHGAALVAQENWTDSLSTFDKLQEGLSHDPLVQRQFGQGDINWAYALVKTGQAPRAAAMLQPLLDARVRQIGEKARSVAELRGYLAIALAASGDTNGALREFQRAVPQLLEATRADQASETGGTARWMRTTNILEAYLELLATLSKTQPGAAAEAFRIADVARGSSVQRALAESAARGAIHDPALAEIARREQDAQHRIGVLSDLLLRLLAAPPEQQLTQIIGGARRDLDSLRTEQASLRRDIEKRFPDYAALTSPQPLTIAETQAVLKPGEVLVSIYVARRKTYVWAVPQKGAPAFNVAESGRHALKERVAHLREALDIADASLANFPKYDLAASYALYAELLKPLEPAFSGANSLLVVPHGALGHLPFAVLTTEPHVLKPDEAAAFATYRDAPWLIKRVAITQLPSVATLATLRRTAAPAGARREFVGFGDPVFTKAQAAQDKAPAGAVTRGVRLRNLAIEKTQTKTALEVDPEAESATKPVPVAVANSSGLAQLAPLPDTSEEILKIAEALHADAGSDVYLRLRANETVIKKLDLSKHRVIAFATHGLVPGDLNGLTQPALALSAPDVVGGEDDGLLTMEEILALRLGADWVVLSACNTASGDGAGAEAVSGLGRAFFFAGARALLVSNWPVETTSARMLTTGLFVQETAQPGISRAEALRLTMLDLMNGPGPEKGAWGFTYSHPMFWAPFSLVGEGAGK